MTALRLYVDVVGKVPSEATILMRTYHEAPLYVPDVGDTLMIGSKKYKVKDKLVSYPALSGGPDCFLTLRVYEVKEPFWKRFWSRLRYPRKRLES